LSAIQDVAAGDGSDIGAPAKQGSPRRNLIRSGIYHRAEVRGPANAKK